MPDGSGLKHRGRKAVESKGEESTGVAAQTACNVPQGSAEEDAEGKEGDAREPRPELPPGRDEQGRGGYEGEQRRMLGVEAGTIAGNFHGKRTGGVGVGGAGDSSAVELSPACGHADFLGGIETV